MFIAHSFTVFPASVEIVILIPNNVSHYIIAAE